MIVLLIAGACIAVGGLVAIAFGIPVHEFSFGNTLILAGTVAACAGAILMGLFVVVRELKGGMRPLGLSDSDAASARSPIDIGMTKLPGNDEFSLGDRPAENLSDADMAAQHPPADKADMEFSAGAEVPDTAPPARPRRNLLFASSSRKERERAAAKNPDSVEPEPEPPAMAPIVPPVQKTVAQPPSFDDAWPRAERGRAEPAPPRPRAPPVFNPNSGPPGPERYAPPRTIEQPPVTVLKSGVVDGMAYSLYSDGSIEAQMPEGMMRFASIDELRSHLDQRP